MENDVAGNRKFAEFDSLEKAKDLAMRNITPFLSH